MYEELIEVLEASLKKNGDKPLTLSHLINILKLTEKKIVHNDHIHDMMGFDPLYD